jgi:hypothetical protein
MLNGHDTKAKIGDWIVGRDKYYHLYVAPVSEIWETKYYVQEPIRWQYVEVRRQSIRPASHHFLPHEFELASFMLTRAGRAFGKSN